jgi:hypothetical protein
MIMTATVADFGFEPSLVGQPAFASEDTVPVEEQVFLLWPRRKPSLVGEVEYRENLTLVNPGTADVAVLPGRNLTADLLLRQNNLKKIKSLIETFFREPFSWGTHEPTEITWETQVASSRFIDLLPDDVALPRVAPDGEGGVTLHWETQDHRHHLGGVDGWRLHFVFDAGQEDARYVDNIKFDGDEIPNQILHSLQ